MVDFKFNSTLRADTPDDVIDIIKAMNYGVHYYMDFGGRDIPAHEFFKCALWSILFTTVADSWPGNKFLFFDRHTKKYFLSVNNCIKNYDNEIEKFRDWISPYLNKPKQIPKQRVEALLLDGGGAITLSIDGNCGCAILGSDLTSGEAEFVGFSDDRAPSERRDNDNTNLINAAKRRAILHAFLLLKERCGGLELPTHDCRYNDASKKVRDGG